MLGPGEGAGKRHRERKKGGGRLGSRAETGFYLPKFPKIRGSRADSEFYLPKVRGSRADSGFYLPQFPGDPFRCFPSRVTAPPEGTSLPFPPWLYTASPGISRGLFLAGMFCSGGPLPYCGMYPPGMLETSFILGFLLFPLPVKHPRVWIKLFLCGALNPLKPSVFCSAGQTELSRAVSSSQQVPAPFFLSPFLFSLPPVSQR